MDHQPSPIALNQPMIDLQVDISGKVEGLAGPIYMAASLYFPPADVLQQRSELPLLVMVHGGSYTRRYWDLIVPGYERNTYNCADFLAQRGNMILTFDLLGMGESQNGLDGQYLTTAMMSDGLVEATRSVKQQLADGTLLGGKKLAVAFSVLVGHSMGTYLAVLTQYRHHAFNALVAQSHTCGPLVVDSEAFSQLPIDAHGYVSLPRPVLYPLLHGSFPPPSDVIAADDQLAVGTPAGLFMPALRSISSEWAASVDVPVLVMYGTQDFAASPHEETSYYTDAPSCQLYIQPEAAHCGNFASTRQQLWQALADFVSSISS
jgi:pimeloyl-ACP methyl ester carboxylesterase